jgi:NAD(P)-dependent dehydrogenase (short-subunit alcohol dehydrogenase family)
MQNDAPRTGAADMDALKGTERGLAGTAAVVTGGAGLIGASISAVLARHGAEIVIVDANRERALCVAADIEAAGGAAVAVEADVGNETDVENAFDAVDRLGVPLRVLVNCAAPVALALQESPAAAIAVSVWDEMIRIALRGTMLCCRSALQRMVGNHRGAIVNISSVHAHAGDLALVAYPVAKAGIVALSRSVATQYGRAGIRCNVVSPGTIPPEGMTDQDIERRVRHQAIDRPGVPNDIAQAVAYLATDASSFVTGQELIVDGGMLCHLPSFATGGHVQHSS